ncbi:MAG: hypothetical protein WCF90_02135 [Methanomicrobiales archaeon]
MVFEHESSAEVILAVTHLYDELIAREDLTNLPPTDIKHLKGDMEGVYPRLESGWLKYMEYLHPTYQYLFNLGMLKNPFDEHARVVVEMCGFTRDIVMGAHPPQSFFFKKHCYLSEIRP